MSVVALALAVTVGPWLLALAVLGPMVVAARWWYGQHAHRREAEQHGTELRARRAQVDRLLAELRRDETLRRRAEHPDPAATVALATTAGHTLDARRAGHATGMVSVGTGTLDWEPGVDEMDGAAYADLARAHARLRGVPVAVDLHRPLALVGPRDATLAVARHVVSSLAVTHGPAHLELALVAGVDRLADWSWATHLPHLAAQRVCTDLASAATVLRTWTAADDGAVPLRVVLLDHADAEGTDARVLRPLPEPPTTGNGALSALVVADDLGPPPATASTTVAAVADRGEPAIVTAPDGGSSEVVPRGLRLDLAEQVARALARHDAAPRPAMATATDGAAAVAQPADTVAAPPLADPGSTRDADPAEPATPPATAAASRAIPVAMPLDDHPHLDDLTRTLVEQR